VSIRVGEPIVNRPFESNGEFISIVVVPFASFESWFKYIDKLHGMVSPLVIARKVECRSSFFLKFAARLNIVSPDGQTGSIS
jgi:hypothetical protein